jgi:SAM-dependent methyltransferase
VNDKGKDSFMRFDFEATFGDDYLYFYRYMLTKEVSDSDTDDIVAALGLAPGDSVLDAPCGHGRISNRLADRGCDVVGVDASELFLDIAREAGSEVDYRLGDLRDLPVDGPFDAALSWFTSFGYFDDDGNRRVLSEYRRVLRPGGRLLIETHNRDHFVRHFAPAPYSHSMHVGDDLMMDSSTFDCGEGRIETDRLVVRDGHVRRCHHSVRLPAITELREWILGAGFSGVEFRARDGQEPAIDRPRLMVLATA